MTTEDRAYADYLTTCRLERQDPLPRDIYFAPWSEQHKRDVDGVDPYTLRPKLNTERRP